MEKQENPRLRASDAEREQVVSALRHAMSEGRLSLAEGEQRMAAAYAATYRDELPPLSADLPPQERTTGTGPEPPGDRPGRPRHHPGPPWRRPGRRPPLRLGLLLAGLAAAGAGALVLAAGRPLWPAIVLGIVALVLLKRTRPTCHRPEQSQS